MCRGNTVAEKLLRFRKQNALKKRYYSQAFLDLVDRYPESKHTEIFLVLPR